MNLASQNKGICEVAQKFRCETLVDGVKVMTVLSRQEALDQVINRPERGLTCEAKYDGSIATVFTGPLDNEAQGIRECAVYACSQLAPTYKVVTLDKEIIDSDSERYINKNNNNTCDSDLSYWYYNKDNGTSNYYKFLPSTSGANITSIRQRSCSAVDAHLSEVSNIPSLPNGDRLSDSYLCLNQVNGLNLDLNALGIAIRDAKTNPPNSVTHIKAGPYTTQKTIQGVAAAKGYPAAHVGLFQNYAETVNLGTVSTLTLVYSTDRYNALVTQYGATNVERLNVMQEPRVGPQVVDVSSTDPRGTKTLEWVVSAGRVFLGGSEWSYYCRQSQRY